MDTYVFHLMPYRDAEGEAWPFASDDWDPETGARYYEEYFQQLELADELGFEGLGFNEHHFSPYGLQPSPVVTAAHMAARTEQADLAFFGNVLPIRANPIRIAEELAMLDNISEGRVLAGFPRGIPVEYLAYDIPYEDSRARFAEALELVRKTWTEDEPFDHQGEFWEFENVYAWPKPYQQPHPRLWMAAESDESLKFAAENRMQVGTGLGSTDGIGERFEKYEQWAEESGWSPTRDDKSIIQMIYVAETDEQAREEAKEHLEFWNKQLLGPVHLGATAIMMGDDRYHPEKRDVYMDNINPHGQMAFEFDFEEAVEEGGVVIGSPETVTADLEHKHETMGGFGKLAAGFQFGSMPPELVKKNLRLYADEVMPEVRAF